MNDIDSVETVEMADGPVSSSNPGSPGVGTAVVSPSGDSYYICGECDAVLNKFE